jgi:hypothetical protein
VWWQPSSDGGKKVTSASALGVEFAEFEVELEMKMEESSEDRLHSEFPGSHGVTGVGMQKKQEDTWRTRRGTPWDKFGMPILQAHRDNGCWKPSWSTWESPVQRDDGPRSLL